MITRTVFIVGLIVLAGTGFLFFTYPAYEPPARYTPPGVTETGAVGAGDFELFLAALAWRENEEGDPNKVCDDGCGCVGLYQITEIYVDDLNWRFPAGHVAFTYDDRKDPEKAARMVNLYLLHYVGKVGDFVTWQDCARIHHGGPNGWRKEYTRGFGEDVVARMEELRR